MPASEHVQTAPALHTGLPDLSLGYVPLTDAAPLLVADAKGFFRANGLCVALTPAASWSALRDRVAFGAWDGGQMLGPMPIAAALGLGGVRADLVVTATLGRNGNTLVLGGSLAEAMGDASFPLTGSAFAAGLRRHRANGAPPPVLAVVFAYSSHNYLLRHWLAEAGVNPEQDVTLVVLAPPALPEALATGQIDGFCAGEPWGSRAVDLRVGRIMLTSGAIWPDHPEKVLALNADLAARDPARIEAATRSVIAAATWLANPENIEEAAHILHHQALPGVPEAVVAFALRGQLPLSPDADPTPVPRAIVHGTAETYPDPVHAAWFLAAMRRWGHVARGGAAPAGVWRPDIWHRVTALPAPFIDTPPTPRSLLP